MTTEYDDEGVFTYRLKVSEQTPNGWREEFVETDMDLEELIATFNDSALVLLTRLVIDKNREGRRYIRRRQDKAYSPRFVLEIIESSVPVEVEAA